MGGPIIVVGSINMDLVFRVPRYPNLGETLPGREFHLFPGGKGANQAVGLARLDADVQMIGAVGRDQYGKELKGNLKNEGVDVSRVAELEDKTGIAAIMVSDDGENRIITFGGANHRVGEEAVEEAEDLFKKAWGVLLQLEIPLETVVAAAKLGKKCGCRVFLDPAPVTELPVSVFQDIDYLLPNQGELETLLPEGKNNEARAKTLLELGVKNLVLKKGNQGCSVYNREIYQEFPAYQVQAVDTTAAGDAFAAAFSWAIQKGFPLEKACLFANAAGGVAASKLGAQSSLPVLEEINKLQKEAEINEVDY